MFSRICVCCNSLRVTNRKVYNIINFVILMKRKNEIKLFDRRLNKLAGKILVFAGENPLVFLDKLSNIVSSKGGLVIMIPTYECVKRWLIDTFTSVRWWMYSPP